MFCGSRSVHRKERIQIRKLVSLRVREDIDWKREKKEKREIERREEK